MEMMQKITFSFILALCATTIFCELDEAQSEVDYWKGNSFKFEANAQLSINLWFIYKIKYLT